MQEHVKEQLKKELVMLRVLNEAGIFRSKQIKISAIPT